MSIEKHQFDVIYFELLICGRKKRRPLRGLGPMLTPAAQTWTDGNERQGERRPLQGLGPMFTPVAQIRTVGNEWQGERRPLRGLDLILMHADQIQADGESCRKNGGRCAALI